ncbi:MAG: hypothetical protein VW405_00270 [Rhodospirillaceae bacterium]
MKRATNRTNARTAAKKRAFLDAYAKCRSIQAAADTLPVARSTVYKWRDGDEEFEAEFTELEHATNDALVETAVNLALFGAKEDVYFRGEVVGQRTIYFPQVLTWMIERRVPAYQLNRDAGGEAASELAANLLAFLGDARRTVPDEPSGN